MALFKRKGEDRELDGLRARRSTLEAKLVKASADLEAAVNGRRRALCKGDDDQPLPNIVELMDLRDGLVDALAQIDAQVAEVEAKVAAERDKAEREKETGRRREQIAAARLALDKLTSAAEEAVMALHHSFL
jgi:hypothetical protein